MNKYNIKVGDYVETWDGAIGYVSGLGPDFFCWYEAPYNSRPNIHSMHMNDLKNYKNIANKFKRIGLNDFGEKKSKLVPINKIDTTWDTKSNVQKELIKYGYIKINELIDHINAIQERLNEYDGTRTN